MTTTTFWAKTMCKDYKQMLDPTVFKDYNHTRGQNCLQRLQPHAGLILCTRATTTCRAQTVYIHQSRMLSPNCVQRLHPYAGLNPCATIGGTRNACLQELLRQGQTVHKVYNHRRGLNCNRMLYPNSVRRLQPYISYYSHSMTSNDRQNWICCSMRELLFQQQESS